MLTSPDEPDELSPPAPTVPNITAPSDILSQGYFESPEAHSLFGLIKDKEEKKNIDEIDLKKQINERIEKLTEGYSMANGWKLNIDDYDSKGLCSAFDIHNLQMKCRYLAMSLRVALSKMDT